MSFSARIKRCNVTRDAFPWGRCRSYPATIARAAGSISVETWRLSWSFRQRSIRRRMVPRKKWRAIPRKARNTKCPTGSKSGHGCPAMILGDGDVADHVYSSFFRDSPRPRVSHYRNVNARCKTFALFPSFTFGYPRVNVDASPTNNAVRPSEVVIESLAGRGEIAERPRATVLHDAKRANNCALQRDGHWTTHETGRRSNSLTWPYAVNAETRLSARSTERCSECVHRSRQWRTKNP